MPRTMTTLASECYPQDNTISVMSATAFDPGCYVYIGEESMIIGCKKVESGRVHVIRATQGTLAQRHLAGSDVVCIPPERTAPYMSIPKPCAWCGGLPPRCCHSEKW